MTPLECQKMAVYTHINAESMERKGTTQNMILIILLMT